MNAGDSARADVAALFFNRDSPALTRTSGVFQSAVHSGAGSWFFTFSSSVPIGEYVAGASNLTGASPVEINVFDGDDTHKFLSCRVGGVGADVNGICAWWSRAFRP